jgi:hypothetical protein
MAAKMSRLVDTRKPSPLEDLAECPHGLRVLIRRSKTDQEGQGQEIAIPRGYRLRPVEAVQTWLAAAEISQGPAFRSVALGGGLLASPMNPSRESRKKYPAMRSTHASRLRLFALPGAAEVRRTQPPPYPPHDPSRPRPHLVLRAGT